MEVKIEDVKAEMTNCSLCQEMVPQVEIREHTAAHFKSRGPANKCETCGKVCGDKTKLREHQRKHTGERPYQCSFCEKTFATKGITKRHEDVTHTQSNFKICDGCGSSFSTRRGLEAHLQKAHGILNRFKCEKCFSYFLTEEGMKQHVSTDFCKESTCTDCGKVFPCKSKLTQHIMRVHSDEKRNFQCVDCGKEFNHEQSLKQHIDIIHLGKRPFECTECSKSFTRLNSLKVHSLTHTNETPFICEYCNQGYKEKRNLIKHIDRQHFVKSDS